MGCQPHGCNFQCLSGLLCLLLPKTRHPAKPPACARLCNHSQALLLCRTGHPPGDVQVQRQACREDDGGGDEGHVVVVHPAAGGQAGGKGRKGGWAGTRALADVPADAPALCRRCTSAANNCLGTCTWPGQSTWGTPRLATTSAWQAADKEGRAAAAAWRPHPRSRLRR